MTVGDLCPSLLAPGGSSPLILAPFLAHLLIYYSYVIASHYIIIFVFYFYWYWDKYICYVFKAWKKTGKWSYDLEYNFFLGVQDLCKKKMVESFGVEFECTEHCQRQAKCIFASFSRYLHFRVFMVDIFVLFSNHFSAKHRKWSKMKLKMSWKWPENGYL